MSQVWVLCSKSRIFRGTILSGAPISIPASHPWHKSGPGPAAPQTIQAQSEVCTDAMVQMLGRDYLTLYLILYKYLPFYSFYAVK